MVRLVSALLLSSSALLALPLRAEAEECAPGRVMLVLDKSSSMQTGTIGGVTKWSIAQDAIDQVASQFEANIELGLTIFPEPNECSPGQVHVGPALFRADAIRDELAEPPPEGGNWTPISQTLGQLATEPSMTDQSMPRYAVLVTDGWQWCSPYDEATRLDAVDTLEQLKSIGVTTYVVGFGDSVDAVLLNKLAVSAGTAIKDCNPNGDTPTAENPCYYQANDPEDLLGALMEIGSAAADEACDGKDNDCDGMVDEELTRDCDGSCGAGSQTCTDGVWSTCSGGSGPEDSAGETCDGADNDCNGIVDDGDGLCSDGMACISGSCQEPGGEGPTSDDPMAEDNSGMTAGCGCRAGSEGSSGATVLLLVAALFCLRRRRASLY